MLIKSIIQNNHFKQNLRIRHKSKQNIQKPPPKVAVDVVKYLESTREYHIIKDKLPSSLLRKYKSPESMYLINRSTAKDIAKTLERYLNVDSPLIEVNPGLGILTEELLKIQNKPIYLYEVSNHFTPYLNDLITKYNDRLKYQVADFFGMWKLAFQDKMDNGTRVQELLGELHTEDSDKVLKIIGSMPGFSFIKHLLYDIIFLNSSHQLRRPDLFIIMPRHRYEFLTDSEVQFSKHKSLPAMFQLLFDYKVLKSVPKVHFLPWSHSPSDNKNNVMNENLLYLVNITQKERLPCPKEYLPLLWYFFKPFVFCKSTRIIPMLEQWIPGCGIWLITGQDPIDTNRKIGPSEEDAPLPHMTIFTEFGDLNLRQKVTLFKKFISWPEFEQSQFKVTMENNLPKSVSRLEDDDKHSISVHIEDIEHSDSESET